MYALQRLGVFDDGYCSAHMREHISGANKKYEAYLFEIWCTNVERRFDKLNKGLGGKKQPNCIHLRSNNIHYKYNYNDDNLKKARAKKSKCLKKNHDFKLLNLIFICRALIGDSESVSDPDVVTESSLPGITESPYLSPNLIIPSGFLLV